MNFSFSRFNSPNFETNWLAKRHIKDNIIAKLYLK